MTNPDLISEEALIQRLTSDDPVFANEYNISKYNAFKYVCQKGIIKLIRLGLENQTIDVDCDKNQETAFSLVLMHQGKNKEIIALMLSSNRVNLNKKSIYMPYFINACQNSDIDVIKMLLNEPNIDPNVPHQFLDNNNMLMLLLSHMHMELKYVSEEEVINLILNDPRCDLSFVNNYKENVFMSVCFGKIKYANMLIDNGQNNLNHQFDLNARNIYGQTAFFKACQFPVSGHHGVTDNDIDEYRRCIISLLENPLIDVNLPDLNGKTPLMIACKNCNDDIIDILMESDRIDKNLVDKQGKTAFDYAFGSKLEIARILYKCSEDIVLSVIKK